MKKNCKETIQRRIVAASLVVILGLPSISTVYASKISEAESAKNQAQSDLDDAQAQINSLQIQKDELQGEIDALDAELVQVIANMKILEDELGQKETRLKELGEELEDAEEDEAEQYKNMKARIRYMYENENTSFLEIIMGAKSFSDLLNRVEYASQVYGHDRDLLEDYQATVQYVADLKVQTEEEKAELEQMHEAYGEQKDEYENMLDSKKDSMSNFNTQLASAERLADEYRDIISQQNAIIQEEQRKEEERKRQEEEQRKKEEAAKKKEEESNKKSPNNQSNKNKKPNTSNIPEDNGKNPPFTTNVNGSDVVDYACQFIGNPYVMGGTSLTEGADCSGFVMSVYANFGISLPHSSFALQSCGQEVSYSNAKPGDLICYSGHVAIYMGGGQIVNASSSAPYPIGGIKTNIATYRQIITVRRVL